MENVTENQQIVLRVTPLGAVIYIAMYLIVIILGITSNGLVILLFFRYQNVRKTVYNYYLVGLAINSFVLSSIGMPLTAYNRIIISEFTCRAFTRSLLFLPAYTVGSSAFFILVAITVDRYIAVTRPFRYHSIMTPLRATLILISMWLIGFVYGSQPLLTFGEDRHQWVCELQHYNSTSVYVHNWIACFLLPFFLMVLFFVYGRIFYVAFIKSNEALASRVRNTPSDAHTRARNRATVTSVIILTTYTICFIPTSFKYIFESYFATNLQSLLMIQTLCEMLVYLFAFVSAVVYARRSPHFRQASRDLLCPQRLNPSMNRSDASSGISNPACITQEEKV